jgi:hypothetical protein
LPTNAASRDSAESRRPSDRRRHDRRAIAPKPPRRIRVRKPRYIGPTRDWAKAWTEARMLPRVRNVPKVVRANVPTTSDRFQTFSIPRRSWIITEWRNAVAASHGRRATFSTGSHAQ